MSTFLISLINFNILKNMLQYVEKKKKSFQNHEIIVQLW